MKSCDLPKNAIGYSPDRGLLMSFNAAFALATQTLIVDPTRRNFGYEERIMRSIRCGFFLVFPSLPKGLYEILNKEDEGRMFRKPV